MSFEDKSLKQKDNNQLDISNDLGSLFEENENIDKIIKFHKNHNNSVESNHLDGDSELESSSINQSFNPSCSEANKSKNLVLAKRVSHKFIGAGQRNTIIHNQSIPQIDDSINISNKKMDINDFKADESNN